MPGSGCQRPPGPQLPPDSAVAVGYCGFMLRVSVMTRSRDVCGGGAVGSPVTPRGIRGNNVLITESGWAGNERARTEHPTMPEAFAVAGWRLHVPFSCPRQRRRHCRRCYVMFCRVV